MSKLFFILIVGVIILVSQTTLLGLLLPTAYKPDMFLILVAWINLKVAFVPGAIFAFFLGMVADIFSGSPTGLFAIIYILVFIICGYFDANFQISGPIGYAVIIFFLSLFTGAVVFFGRWLTAQAVIGSHTYLWFIIKSLVTAFVSLFVFPLLDKFHASYLRFIGESRE